MTLKKNSTASILRSVLKDRKKCYLGFTLIELMLVIFIIGTLSAISIPVYGMYIEKARVIRTIAEVRMLEREIQAYMYINEVLPDSLDNIGRGNLLDPWGNPYKYLNIDKIIKSANEGGGGGKGKGKGKGEEKGKASEKAIEQMKVKGARFDRWEKPLNLDFDLFSIGKDGDSKENLRAKASRDDIVRASDGAYVGLGSEYS